MIQQDAWLVAQGGLNPEYQNPEDINFSDFLEEIADQECLPDYLSAGLAINDPLSRSPSPMPSPMPSPLPTIDHPEPSLWPNRYQIHNDAFAALSSSFFSIHDSLSPICLRYILMPLIILALTSRKDSAERSLCHSYFARYKEFMETNYPRDPPQSDPETREERSSSPCGGEELNIDIPWEKLDEFSELAEQRQRSSMGGAEGALTMGAPEWNWWDMLNHLKIDMTCKCFVRHRSLSNPIPAPTLAPSDSLLKLLAGLSSRPGSAGTKPFMIAPVEHLQQSSSQSPST
jgi:hypothetical protein